MILCVELQEKLDSNESNDFFLFKILRAHILPLTNCAFNKSGDKFITGSFVHLILLDMQLVMYDREL